MTELSLSQKHYSDALRTMLANPVTRIFLWRIIVEDCKVFEEGYPMNAAAYCLLAKQEIGKRLLADAKNESLDLVLQAEKEYNALMEANKKQMQGDE